MVLADGAVLGHVASGLAHEPDGGSFGGFGLRGANKQGFGSGHEPSNLAFFERGTAAQRPGVAKTNIVAYGMNLRM